MLDALAKKLYKKKVNSFFLSPEPEVTLNTTEDTSALSLFDYTQVYLISLPNQLTKNSSQVLLSQHL